MKPRSMMKRSRASGCWVPLRAICSVKKGLIDSLFVLFEVAETRTLLADLDRSTNDKEARAVCVCVPFPCSFPRCFFRVLFFVFVTIAGMGLVVNF